MENYQPGEGSERVPLLLSRQSRDKHEDSPQERDGRGVVDTEPDAIDQLEKLPVLLVHSVIVFTSALCTATAIRLVRFGVAISVKVTAGVFAPALLIRQVLYSCIL